MTQAQRCSALKVARCYRLISDMWRHCFSSPNATGSSFGTGGEELCGVKKDKQLFREKKYSDPDDPVSSEETCISLSKTQSKISKLDQIQLKDASEKNSNTNPSNEIHLWPSEWTYNQWIQKKVRYPWLICDNGKIGCLNCKNVGELKTCKSQGVEISTEWNQINVDGDLQSRDATLIQADKKIKRTIRVIDFLKTIDGDYYAEAVKAIKQIMFKDIPLYNNEEDKIIIQDIQILDKKTWPADVNICFGEEEVKRLCNRFLLNQEKTLRGLRILIDEETNEIEELNEINNLIKTIPCSTAECERGFSLMNIICTDIRSRLTIQNISNLMMININGPPLSIWNPEDYVKS
ncbi:hypothetical protein QTP88_013612 [Uroleucon formosanum]